MLYAPCLEQNYPHVFNRMRILSLCTDRHVKQYLDKLLVNERPIARRGFDDSAFKEICELDYFYTDLIARSKRV